MFVVASATVWNPAALETRGVPKRFFGRAMPIPRRDAGWRLVARWVFEMQVLRYLVSLAPFMAAMLLWPDLALPIAQAPLAMILVIGLVEMKVLTPSDDARAALIDADEADRVLDRLGVAGRRILSDIAARHAIAAGELHLVVEQSELARIAPLTFVSVQAAVPAPHLFDLGPEDRRVLATLFDETLSERALHAVALSRRTPLRQVSFDARGVSGHERLAAALARRAAPAPA